MSLINNLREKSSLSMREINNFLPLFKTQGIT